MSPAPTRTASATGVAPVVGALVAAGGDAELSGRPEADVAGGLADALEVAVAPGPGRAGGHRETNRSTTTTTMAAIVTVGASREFERFVLATRPR